MSILYGISNFLAKPNHIMIFINPDVNTYTYLARNLIYEHGSLLNWNLGAAPYYFPDIMFIFLISFFIKNPFHTLLLYTLFQIIFFIFIITLILKSAIKTEIGLRLGLISSLLFLLILVLVHSTNTFATYAYASAILVPSFHFGMTLMVFTCLYVFSKLLMSPKISSILCLCLFAVLGGISDPLFYIFFIIPTLVTISILFLFRYMTKANYYKLVFLVTSIFILTYTIYHFLPVPADKQKLILSFNLFYFFVILKSIYSFIIKDLGTGLLWIFFIFFAPISLWQTHKQKKSANLFLNYIILFEWMSVFVGLVLIWLTIKPQYADNLNYIIQQHPSFQPNHVFHYLNELLPLQFRYLIPILLGPAFIGTPLLLYKQVKHIHLLKNNMIFISVLLLFALIAFPKTTHSNEYQFFHFQPHLISCIDKHAKKFHLTDGISDSFVGANMLNSYDEANLHMMFLLINKNHFTFSKWQDTNELSERHDYDFAVLIHPSSIKSLLRNFGKPTHSFICEGNFIHKYYVYVYKNGALRNILSPKLKKVIS